MCRYEAHESNGKLVSDRRSISCGLDNHSLRNDTEQLRIGTSNGSSRCTDAGYAKTAAADTVP